jgi:hypothetical protein
MVKFGQNEVKYRINNPGQTLCLLLGSNIGITCNGQIQGQCIFS